MKLHFTAISIVALLVFLGCGQEAYWEKTLAGPFPGEPIQGEAKDRSASSLQLTPTLLLTVHTNESTNGPVLRLGQAGRSSEWARLLVPRKQGENEPRGRINELTLKTVKTNSNGFKIFLTCDWTGGGKEGGLVYLNKDYSFRSFALGW